MKIVSISITILGLLFYIETPVIAKQSHIFQEKPPSNWFNLDKDLDNVFGISTERSYQELLKDKSSTTVVVAIIDSGVDIKHEDLRDKIWKNEDEIAGNNNDDDNNGYIDDIYGWNFIGGKDGKNVYHDTYEITREYVRLKDKYGNKQGNEISRRDRKEYMHFLEIQRELKSKIDNAKSELKNIQNFRKSFLYSRKLLKVYLDKEEIYIKDIENIESSDEKIEDAKKKVLYAMKEGLKDELNNLSLYYENHLKYAYDTNFNSRDIIGDDYTNPNERYYGNNDVIGPYSEHGTHVAGIIAASRENDIGIKGIVDNVQIMSIRTVPDGDERDKDIANAIYYAVDNGAKVINMSFGKGYSPRKEIVDKAVKYAERKGVLLVHAAGNGSSDVDKIPNFPNRKYKNTKRIFKNWIEVGALSWRKKQGLVAEFSNFGKESVDFFAPGVDIYSTIPKNGYKNSSGTSMAAPMSTGAAALLISYFPHLTPSQIKEILIQSTVKVPNQEINRPGGDENEKLVKLRDLCRTGGILNVYEAIKRAEKLSKKSE